MACGEVDALEAEERGVELFDAALSAARMQRAAPRRGRPASGDPSGRIRRVARTVEAIGAEPQRKWTLGDLASLACVSPGHLAHVFRAEMGMSVYNFVLRSRLARALDAVLDSDAGLTSIALDWGFASHSHFTAKFRALFGRTPQQLRCGVRRAAVCELRRIVAAPQLATA
jgi:transcriptional regulator GlxA family with amidase domain